MFMNGWGLLLALAVLLCCTLAGAADEKPAPEKADPVVAEVQRLLHTRDSFAAAEYLEAEGDPKTVSLRYHRVMNDLYKKQHDLPAVVSVARFGIHYCVSRAQGLPEAPAAELRSLGKTMAYNLAAFTWAGWDDASIHPTASDEATGLDAARLNLRLAIELKRGPGPLLNAHWMLGAHQLGLGKFSEAIRSFEQAAEFARQDKNRGGELMAQGYVLLTQLMQGPDPAAETAFRANAEALPKEPDGEFFRDQLIAARKVFAARFKR